MSINFPNLSFGKIERIDSRTGVGYLGLDIREKEKERTNSKGKHN